jgi:hypothetical protein
MTFADGTEYTVKAESMVTVEENNVTREQSNTAVRINTGQVDLATQVDLTKLKAAVSVEDATAMVQQNSRASVRTTRRITNMKSWYRPDPRKYGEAREKSS